MPVVFDQQPDIFISVFNKEKEDERLAYLRIPRHFKELESEDPNWYPLKGATSHKDINTFALLNV